MTVLLAVDLGRVFLQPLVLLHHHCEEGHRHHDHPLVVHQTQILLVHHHQCPLIRRRRYLEFLQRREAEVRHRHHPLEVRHQY